MPGGRRAHGKVPAQQPDGAAARTMAGFDGPGDSSQGSRGRAPSVGPKSGGPSARSQSRGRSAIRGSEQQGQTAPHEKLVLQRNVDFGGMAYNLISPVSSIGSNSAHGQKFNAMTASAFAC